MRWWLPIAASLWACASEDPLPGGASLATEVVEAPGASGEGFGDPSLAINGVRGQGQSQGSLDVYTVPPSAYLVLGWHGDLIEEVDGPDLVVFENPFDYAEGRRFMEPAVVEVSHNGVDWVAFPHSYQSSDPSVYVDDPALWQGLAGVTPVHLHEENNPVDPMSPSAGGDAFDLSDLDVGDPLVEEVLDQGVRYVRVSQAPYPTDPVANGPDIDGVYAWTTSL